MASLFPGLDLCKNPTRPVGDDRDLTISKQKYIMFPVPWMIHRERQVKGATLSENRVFRRFVPSCRGLGIRSRFFCAYCCGIIVFRDDLSLRKHENSSVKSYGSEAVPYCIPSPTTPVAYRRVYRLKLTLYPFSVRVSDTGCSLALYTRGHADRSCHPLFGLSWIFR